MFRKFAFQYADSHAKLKKQYKDGFKFAQQFNINASMWNNFLRSAKENGVETLQAKKAEEDYIKMLLKANIGRRVFGDEGFYPVYHTQDNQLKKAIEFMPEAINLMKN